MWGTIGHGSYLDRADLASPLGDVRGPIPITITVELFDSRPRWKSLAGASDADRKAFIQGQQAAVDASQQDLVAWLGSVGAKKLASHWLANSLEVEIPAGAVDALLARSDVRGAALPARLVPDGDVQQAGWDGYASQNALRTWQMHTQGITGHHGSNLGTHHGRIKIGVIEAFYAGGQNWPPSIHVGWNRALGAATRLRSIKHCNDTGCSPHQTGHEGNSPGGGHGAAVAEIAAGTIEAGQDPNFPGAQTTDQRRRSGQIPDAYVRYYLADTSVGFVNALQTAISDGIDVINMSFEIGPGQCNAQYDFAGYNAAITHAVDLGHVLVGTAGNNNAAACSEGYPGLRSEVLAIGGLESPDPADAYSSLLIYRHSSLGGVPVKSFSGANTTLSGIALVAPAEMTFNYSTNATASNYTTVTWAGTSFAAPQVTGMIGLLRNAWWSIGWDATDARMMMANAILMGDGGGTLVGMDPLAGAGKPRAHYPTAPDIVAPTGWGRRAIAVHAGDDITWTVGPGGPEDSRITQYKVAFLYTWNDAVNGGPGGMQNIPDVDFFIEDTCPSGGGIVTIAADVGYDMRSRMRLNQSQISGKCLRVRMHGYGIPSSGVTVYAVDYFHSGDPSVH